MSAAIRAFPRYPSTLIAFLIVTVLGIGSLAVAGATDQRTTAFSLGVQKVAPVTDLQPGHQVCQGPITASTAFGGVRIWVGAVLPPGAPLRLVAKQTSGGLKLAAGTLRAPAGAASDPTARLDHPVDTGSIVSICVTNGGHVVVPLLGSAANPRSGVLSGKGSQRAAAGSMVLLTPHSSSLLRLLPTAFSRAALFHPAWMSAWTFWVLLVAAVLTFPLACWAIVLAGRADEPDDLSSPGDPARRPVV